MGDFGLGLMTGLVVAIILFGITADDVIHYGRLEVASGKVVCAQDIAGDWRCVEKGK